ncbi:hypothetical protein K4L04_12700 [Phaeobacter inhibens]|uniref:hypothetical protein n=1 Tax=Phaeobacter inhibens TaxID=221822 RepID=UPI0021A27FFE|nr:hypothetical protein [Phaeobacter inhibens]UWR78251.1 hypothetical protein K4L04_12700 [Phaeobacter inhibens]
MLSPPAAIAAQDSIENRFFIFTSVGRIHVHYPNDSSKLSSLNSLNGLSIFLVWCLLETALSEVLLALAADGVEKVTARSPSKPMLAAIKSMHY